MENYFEMTDMNAFRKILADRTATVEKAYFITEEKQSGTIKDVDTLGLNI